MHISFKTIKFYFTLCCSTCFGHHCVHHQELLSAAHYSIISLMVHGTINVKFICFLIYVAKRKNVNREFDCVFYTQQST
jgi:hypothetical protein